MTHNNTGSKPLENYRFLILLVYKEMLCTLDLVFAAGAGLRAMPFGPLGLLEQ